MAKSLRSFLEKLKAHPEEMTRVEGEVDPAQFQVSSLLQHLEDLGKYPLVYFTHPKNLLGEPSPFPLVANLFATRQRCALALDLSPEQWRLELSLEYARRERPESYLKPEVIGKDQAPVKEVVRVGDEADLRAFPVVRAHHMDGGPYLNMTPIMKDPQGRFHNAAFLRTQYKGPNRLGIYMSPRHNWHIFQAYEGQGLPTPVIIVMGHHPSFYLGALNVGPFGDDDYEAIGGVMGTPLRLVESESWGKEFLVPADAEVIIEGEILPHERQAEGPYGEFTGYYGPQRLSPLINVRAITHRREAIFTYIFTGHRDNWILGGIPKEGSIFNTVRGVVPGTRAVHFPVSGCCRFHCYISIEKRVEGEPKQAALAAMADCDFVKHVIVVDADIDPFNEQQVMWAVATRVQADQDLDIIRHIKANPLDPSLTHSVRGTKMIIDATKPIDRPFALPVQVPPDALAKTRLEDYLDKGEINRLPETF